MNWNKMGTYIRNSANNLSNKLFGITTRKRKPKLKHLNTQKADAHFERQLSKAFVETELPKSQALEYLRRFQNR